MSLRTRRPPSSPRPSTRAGAPAAILVGVVVAALAALTVSPAAVADPSAAGPAQTSHAQVSPAEASAAVSRDTGFEAGEIISDDNFFDYQSMTAAGVQEFLESVSCTPRDDSPCLADYHQRTPTRATSRGRCERYAGRSSETAASIIWRVAQACKISPRVLLVLVQKEQSLLTHPSAAGYQKATGYGCPDTAACDSRYYGFFNQVYDAAWQFREYTLHPSEFRYRIGSVRVAYHPDAACGSSVVDIRDQATANLYNYTPYQPNAETLSHPDGPGGDCSAYGNLNFERLYQRWFGDPRSVAFPGWEPACLNYAGGGDCTVNGDPFDLIPGEAYAED